MNTEALTFIPTNFFRGCEPNNGVVQLNGHGDGSNSSATLLKGIDPEQILSIHYGGNNINNQQICEFLDKQQAIDLSNAEMILETDSTYLNLNEVTMSSENTLSFSF